MKGWTPDEVERRRAKLSPEEQAELDALLAHVPPPDSLLEFIPRTSPKFVAPAHLQPLVEVLERSRHESVTLVSSTPPRHGKTELLLHFIAWLLAHDPSHQIAYVTHTGRLALMKSAKARQLAMAAGVPISMESNSKSDWRTGVGEGGVWATSTGGAIVGLGFKTIIVDDPVKGRNDVESALQRENDWNWFNGDLFNRLEPGGSIIVNMARWHDDDLSGRLVREGWRYINLQAICDDPARDPLGRAVGEPLWPERWPVEALAPIRAKSEYDWVSLYQGTPRTREGRLFEGVKTYTDAPKTLRFAIGVDLAYSEKTAADWSVAVVLGEHDGTWYVLDVVRRQVRADVFAGELLILQTRFPTAPIRWYAAGTEKGSADFMKALGVKLSVAPVVGDKFIRAQPVAAAWKAGKVLVPTHAPWLADFLGIVSSFTGIGDIHDDDVDALAAAFDVLPARAVSKEPRIGSPEWQAREAEKMREAARQAAERSRLAKSGTFVPNDPLLRRMR